MSLNQLDKYHEKYYELLHAQFPIRDTDDGHVRFHHVVSCYGCYFLMKEDEVFGQEEQEELDESYQQSLANKKEREKKEMEEKLRNLKK